MKNTDKWPTYVNVSEVEEDQYLVNILMNRNQLWHLQEIAQELRGRRSGQYHAMVASIEDAIQEFWDQEEE